MNLFTIAQLTQFSGIKPHTIRVWEKRYGALSPNRSEGNTRYYTGNQLKRLLNIITLLNSQPKYRASDICVLSDEELNRKIAKEVLATLNLDKDYEALVNQLLAGAATYNEKEFSDLLNKSIESLGVRETYLKVMLPLLMRVGLLWLTDILPPAQEHFISNIFKQKLFALINMQQLKDQANQTWILFLPENESHEIGLLFGNLMIRTYGQKVIYLGANMPLASLEKCVQATGATHLMTFFVRNDRKENYDEIIKTMAKKFPGLKLAIAGKEGLLNKLEISSSMLKITDVRLFEDYLKYNT